MREGDSIRNPMLKKRTGILIARATAGRILLMREAVASIARTISNRFEWFPSLILILLAPAMSLVFLDSELFLVSCILGWALLALGLIDVRFYLLPNVVTFPLIAAGLTVVVMIDATALPAHVFGAALGFGAFWLLSTAYRWLRGRTGLGLGDAKLLAAAGAWLGWQALPSVVLLASFGALGFVLAMALSGRRVDASTRLPFGPFLCAGFWVVWLYGPLEFA